MLSARRVVLANPVTDTITINTRASGTLPYATGTWTLNLANNPGMIRAKSIGGGNMSSALTVIATYTFSPPSAGHYYFRAVYFRDKKYLSSTSFVKSLHVK